MGKPGSEDAQIFTRYRAVFADKPLKISDQTACRIGRGSGSKNELDFFDGVAGRRDRYHLPYIHLPIELHSGSSPLTLPILATVISLPIYSEFIRIASPAHFARPPASTLIFNSTSLPPHFHLTHFNLTSYLYFSSNPFPPKLSR